MEWEFGWISLFRAEKKNAMLSIFSSYNLRDIYQNGSWLCLTFCQKKKKKKNFLSSSRKAWEMAEGAYRCILFHINILYETWTVLVKSL